MSRRKNIGLVLCGLALGLTLSGPAAQAVETLTAIRSNHRILVDGQEVQMEAYKVNGNNYVKLRDIGKAVGFNVYWDSENGCVQVETDKPYTGEAPKTAQVNPTESAQTATKSETDLAALRAELVERVNAVRIKNGTAPLKVNQSLMDAAQKCAEKQFTSHNNRVECETAAACGYPHGFGSNLTVMVGVSPTAVPERAVTNWGNSSGHFQTMIDPECDSIGVGITIDSGRAFCYLFVGNPNSCNPYS